MSEDNALTIDLIVGTPGRTAGLRFRSGSWSATRVAPVAAPELRDVASRR